MRFEEFAADASARLGRLAGALTGDSSLAEDILSEALINVWRRWRRIGSLDDPEAYVRRVVVTTFLDDRRRRQRRRTDPTASAWLLDSAVPDPADGGVSEHATEDLLAALTDQQRAAVTLKYLYGFDDRDIGAAMGCTRATVRSHLSHARKVLRLEMQEREVDR